MTIHLSSPDEPSNGGISTVLANAARATDADTAAILADVLNTDLAALERMTGRRRFDAQDALRISRILAEYEHLALGERS